jgi:RNA polymerase sigma-70 factor (ECF subfamily)
VNKLSVADRGLDHAAPGRGSLSEDGFLLVSTDQSIARIVRRHGPMLFRFLLRLTHGDRQRAEDIYQETLIRAWKHPECCEDEDSIWSSRPWLFTVARHVSIDQLRAAAIRPAMVSDEHLAATPDPVDPIDQLLLARDVRATVAKLSPQHREVIREIYFEDRPAAEVAQRIGVPVGTVKSRTYYALRALKTALAGSRAGYSSGPGLPARALRVP